MRLDDKEHFRCPDCSTLLHRNMFSGHPAECTNKTQLSHAKKEESNTTVADNEHPLGGNIAGANAFENYENQKSNLGNDTKIYALIQDESSKKISKVTSTTPNFGIESPIELEVKFSCPYCNFKSPYMATINIHKQILHNVYQTKRSSGRKYKVQEKHRPKAKDNQGANIKTQYNHNTKDNLVCSVCGAIFTVRISLKRRNEIRHGDVINFSCNECGQ